MHTVHSNRLLCDVVETVVENLNSTHQRHFVRAASVTAVVCKPYMGPEPVRSLRNCIAADLALSGIETMTGDGQPTRPVIAFSAGPSEVNFVRGRRRGDRPGSLRTENCIRFALIARTSLTLLEAPAVANRPTTTAVLDQRRDRLVIRWAYL